jgi:hypothetical protein
MAADDHLDGLREEIIRKKSQLDERAWAEGRLPPGDVQLPRGQRLLHQP